MTLDICCTQQSASHTAIQQTCEFPHHAQRPEHKFPTQKSTWPADGTSTTTSAAAAPSSAAAAARARPAANTRTRTASTTSAPPSAAAAAAGAAATVATATAAAGGVFVKGTIIELRLDKGFGFIRPQTLGAGDEVFLHFGSGLAPGVSAKELVVGMEVTFIIGENEEGARARSGAGSPPPDPLASLRPAGMEAPIGRRGGGGGRGGAGAWGSGGNIRDIQRQQTTQNRHVSAAARFGGKLNTAPLLLLLRATSPEVVDRVFEASFRNRKALQLPAEEAMVVARELKIDKPPKVHTPPRNSAPFLNAQCTDAAPRLHR